MLKRGEGVHRSMYVLIRRCTGNPYTLSILLQTEDDRKKKKNEVLKNVDIPFSLLLHRSVCSKDTLEILCPHVLSKQMARGLCRASSHVVLHAFFLSSLFVA